MTERPTRAQEAARRAELAAAHDRSESLQAQKLIDAFVAEATRRGLPTEPLRATLIGSTIEVRTDQQGWYIKENRSVAIGPNGEYFVLIVAGGWLERLRGVRVEPTPPPLVVSRGGRDGETGDLKFFLNRYLDLHG